MTHGTSSANNRSDFVVLDVCVRREEVLKGKRMCQSRKEGAEEVEVPFFAARFWWVGKTSQRDPTLGPTHWGYASQDHREMGAGREREQV